MLGDCRAGQPQGLSQRQEGFRLERAAEQILSHKRFIEGIGSASHGCRHVQQRRGHPQGPSQESLFWPVDCLPSPPHNEFLWRMHLKEVE
jgi:hypothetical protein